MTSIRISYCHTACGYFTSFAHHNSSYGALFSYAVSYESKRHFGDLSKRRFIDLNESKNEHKAEKYYDGFLEVAVSSFELQVDPHASSNAKLAAVEAAAKQNGYPGPFPSGIGGFPTRFDELSYKSVAIAQIFGNSLLKNDRLIDTPSEDQYVVNPTELVWLRKDVGLPLTRSTPFPSDNLHEISAIFDQISEGKTMLGKLTALPKLDKKVASYALLNDEKDAAAHIPQVRVDKFLFLKILQS